jgi:hypothetical protein
VGQASRQSVRSASRRPSLIAGANRAYRPSDTISVSRIQRSATRPPLNSSLPLADKVESRFETTDLASRIDDALILRRQTWHQPSPP